MHKLVISDKVKELIRNPPPRKQTCKSCYIIHALQQKLPPKHNYGYWLSTELFMILHNGKDYCE